MGLAQPGTLIRFRGVEGRHAVIHRNPRVTRAPLCYSAALAGVAAALCGPSVPAPRTVEARSPGAGRNCSGGGMFFTE